MATVTAGRGESRSSLPRWLAPTLLAVAIGLAYGNSLNTPFLFDDTGAVVNNPTIRHLFSWAALQPPADGSTTTGRPIVNLSYAINHAISGDQVWGYHLTNLGLHLIAALALMGILQRTLSGPVCGRRWADSSASVAFWSALIWALHPLQTESVVGIAQRTESLCGMFYLLTLYGFVRANSPGERSPRAWLGVSFVSCLAGMGTKEVMVTAPVVILFFDRTFVAGNFSTAWRQRRGFYAALAATWLLLAWLVWRNSGGRGAAAGFGLGITGWNYLLQQAAALVLYLKLSVWPHPLVLDYGTNVAHSLGDVWWQGTIVLALLAATGWALVRRPVVGFLGAWFFLILAPSSSVVPLVTQTMAEHRMYLPLAAVICVFVMSLQRALGSRASWLLAVAALACAALTVGRNHDYRDPVAMWNDTVVKYPLNPRAHNNLAWAWEAKANHDEANRHFARAVELQPDYVSAHYNWGVALLDQGRAADAIAQFEAAVKGAPGHADAYLNLGNALMQVDRAPEAIAYYQQALKLRPAADVNYNLGVGLIAANRPVEAVTYLQTALRSDPRLPDAHYQLGRVAEIDGRDADAERDYQATLQLAPDHVGAHRQLGLLLAGREQFAAAAAHFQAVVRFRPDDADSQANLGNALLLDGKPREAITCYETSLRLRPDDPRTSENLRLAREALAAR